MIANERPLRAPMRETRNVARNATSSPTNKPTNISTNKPTNKPTFFNNVFEAIVLTPENLTGQRDVRRRRLRSKGRLLKNVGFLTLLAARRGPPDYRRAGDASTYARGKARRGDGIPRRHRQRSWR